MSRYETLCAALRDLREKYAQHRLDCYALTAQMVDGLREFLGVDEDLVSFFATQGSWQGKKVDGPAGALNLGDDTFWHFGVSIDVMEEVDQMPCHTIGFEFRLKRLPEHYLLAIIPDGPQFQVSAAAPEADLRAVYEHLYQHSLKRYGEAYRGYFVEGEPAKRFGF
jgi:hypothetical protein